MLKLSYNEATKLQQELGELHFDLTAKAAFKNKGCKFEAVYENLDTIITEIENEIKNHNLLKYKFFRRFIKINIMSYDKNFINEMKKCNKCICSNCEKCMLPSKTPYLDCINGRILDCNMIDYCIVSKGDILTLHNDIEDIDQEYKILGKYIDVKENKSFYYLEEINNKDNQHIIEYVKNFDGTIEYKSISEEKLDEIYKKFVGIKVY